MRIGTSLTSSGLFDTTSLATIEDYNDDVPSGLFKPSVLEKFASELEGVDGRVEVSIGGTPTTLAGLELLAEGVDGSLRSHTTPVYMWDVKPLVESPPPASTNSFTIPRLNRDCDTSRGYVDPKIEQHTLYQTPSQPGVSA